MGSFPNTSSQSKNDQCRLSLLENEECPSTQDLTKGQAESGVESNNGSNTQKPDIISAPWMLQVPPPGPYPPQEKSQPLKNLLRFCRSTIFNLMFYSCLPVSIAAVACSVFPRLLAKLLLSVLHNGRIQLLPGHQVIGSREGSVNTVLLICSGKCDIESMKDHMGALINSRNPCTGRRDLCHLRKRVVHKYGYLCLTNCVLTFDINNHVKQFESSVTKGQPVGYNDIVSYLESTYEDPFENDPATPQWEIRVIPSIKAEEFNLRPVNKSDQAKALYAIIFRFHNGIMNWPMFQELLSKYMGKTKGKTKASFCPDTREIGLWGYVQSKLTGLVYGPPALLRNVFSKWSEFAGLTHFKDEPQTSFAASKAISMETMADIQERTCTGNDSILASCARIAVRNLVLGQNMEFPSNLKIARTFHLNKDWSPQIDTVTIDYVKFRNCVERLHASYHGIDNNEFCLGGRRSFNKLVLLCAGWLPYQLSSRLHRMLVKADLLMEICPCSDKPYKIFNQDTVEDIYVWPDSKGLESNFKITVTDYCDLVKANVVGQLGELSGGLTDAQIISKEFEAEYEHLASAIGMYPHQIYPSAMRAS